MKFKRNLFITPPYQTCGEPISNYYKFLRGSEPAYYTDYFFNSELAGTQPNPYPNWFQPKSELIQYNYTGFLEHSGRRVLNEVVYSQNNINTVIGEIQQVIASLTPEREDVEFQGLGDNLGNQPVQTAAAARKTARSFFNEVVSMLRNEAITPEQFYKAYEYSNFSGGDLNNPPNLPPGANDLIAINNFVNQTMGRLVSGPLPLVGAPIRPRARIVDKYRLSSPNSPVRRTPSLTYIDRELGRNNNTITKYNEFLDNVLYLAIFKAANRQDAQSRVVTIENAFALLGEIDASPVVVLNNKADFGIVEQASNIQKEAYRTHILPNLAELFLSYQQLSSEVSHNVVTAKVFNPQQNPQANQVGTAEKRFMYWSKNSRSNQIGERGQGAPGPLLNLTNLDLGVDSENNLFSFPREIQNLAKNASFALDVAGLQSRLGNTLLENFLEEEVRSFNFDQLKEYVEPFRVTVGEILLSYQKTLLEMTPEYSMALMTDPPELIASALFDAAAGDQERAVRTFNLLNIVVEYLEALNQGKQLIDSRTQLVTGDGVRAFNVDDFARQRASNTFNDMMLVVMKPTILGFLSLEKQAQVINSAQGVEFEFAPFDNQTPWVFSRDTTPLFDSPIPAFRANVNPEYNYFIPNYETAISASFVPEAALPNFYVYNIVAASFDGGDVPDGWRGNEFEGEETLAGFERLITLNEAISAIVPLPGSSPERIEEMTAYFENYSQQVSSGVVTLDTWSSLARQYYQMATPASNMDIYTRFNNAKAGFPFYIETSFETDEVGEASEAVEESLVSPIFNTALNRALLSGDTANMRIITDRYSNPLFQRVIQGDEEEAQDQGRFNAVQKESFLSNLSLSSFSTTLVPLLGTTVQDNELVKSLNFNGLESEAQNRLAARLRTQSLTGQLGVISREQYKRYGELVSNAANPTNDPNNTAVNPYLLSGKNVLAPSAAETIGYKIIKKDPENDNRIIQTFYFPNTNDEELIQFVDTQIKFDKFYRYELHGIKMVYGTKSVFKTRRAVYPIKNFQIVKNEGRDELNYSPNSGYLTKEQIFSRYGAVDFQFIVENQPATKLVEYPIFSDIYRQIAQDNRPGKSADGLALPDVKVLSHPPSPPDLMVYPFMNNYRQILMVANPSRDTFRGERALPTTPLTVDEVADNQRIFEYQREFENFSLRPGFLEYKNEGVSDTRRVEIYRTTSLNEIVEEYRDLYRSFPAIPHLVMDTSNDPEVPEENQAIDFSRVDTLEPNVIYYYTARVQDQHGLYSPFSYIYSVELVFDGGLYYPIITPYVLDPKTPSMPTKTMTRFLQVKPADIQTYVFTGMETNDEGERSVISRRGLAEAVSVEQEGTTSTIYNSEGFIVRLTSKDTGRKIDIRLNAVRRD